MVNVQTCMEYIFRCTNSARWKRMLWAPIFYYLLVMVMFTACCQTCYNYHGYYNNTVSISVVSGWTTLCLVWLTCLHPPACLTQICLIQICRQWHWPSTNKVAFHLMDYCCLRGANCLKCLCSLIPKIFHLSNYKDPKHKCAAKFI